MAAEKPTNTAPLRVRRRNDELHVRDAEGRRVQVIRQGVTGEYGNGRTYGYDADGAYRVSR